MMRDVGRRSNTSGGKKKIMQTIDQLFSKSNNVFNSHIESEMKPIPKMKGSGFFPGGRGIFTNGKGPLKKSKPLNEFRYMFLGQDWSNEFEYNNIPDFEDSPFLINTDYAPNEKNNKTWINVKKFIANLNIDTDMNIDIDDCFFTNAIMGLRPGNSSSTGKSPGWNSDKFMAECYKFFKIQIDSIKPKIVFVMGNLTARFIYKVYGNLFSDWDNIKDVKELFNQDKFCVSVDGVQFIFMTHPSLRPPNIKKRWKDKGDVELAKTKTLLRIQ